MAVCVSEFQSMREGNIEREKEELAYEKRKWKNLYLDFSLLALAHAYIYHDSNLMDVDKKKIYFSFAWFSYFT